MTEKEIKRYFKIAKKVSKLSDFKNHRKIQIGAILVYKKRIVSSGFNSLKTNPTQDKLNIYRDFYPKPYPYIHAEVNCILHCKEKIDWEKAKLFIYRENGKSNLPVLAAPCNGCKHLIIQKGIKNIYYTTNNGYIHEQIKVKEDYK